MLVRLGIEDKLLLDARAEARGMRPATYVSVLLRSHFRKLTPLPKDEYLALNRSIGELASIGRNINQIAKASNEGGRMKDFYGHGISSHAQDMRSLAGQHQSASQSK
jgi:hypothetical protein